ncbi:hypothetical protein IGI04_036595, partial [Brassica rapa subsp. trilocularis]
MATRKRLGITRFSLLLHCISLYQVLEFPLEFLETSKAPERGTGATCDTRSRRVEVGATSCTEVIHPLQAQLLVDDFHDLERPLGATSRTRARCRATSGATSSTRTGFWRGEARQEELCFINNNGSWYRKEPNFQYNNYQQKSYSNNQQGGYQQRQTLSKGTISLGKTPPLVSTITTISLLKLKEVLHKLQLQIQVWMQ